MRVKRKRSLATVLAVGAATAFLAAASPVSAKEGPSGAANPGGTERQIRSFLDAHPDAVRYSRSQVAWQDGAVILTWPDPRTGKVSLSPADRPDLEPGEVGASDVNGCPAGITKTNKYCFYEHSSFGGRMLQFQDCGGDQFFDTYGFSNQTSSWVNTTSNVVRVYDGFISIWDEPKNSKSSYVGAAANDKADSFHTYCP
jgi:hypothetical protein